MDFLAVLDRPAPPPLPDTREQPPEVFGWLDQVKAHAAAVAPAPEPIEQPKHPTATALYLKRHEGREMIAVDPKRLQSGYFGEGKEGDVRRSMSCQSLAEEGRIRTPFRLNGADWVQTSGMYGPDGDYYECFKVVPVEAFDGPHESYSERNDRRWEAARNNPLGGYHGMSAKSNGRTVVLQGPPIILVAGATQQADLF